MTDEPITTLAALAEFLREEILSRRPDIGWIEANDLADTTVAALRGGPTVDEARTVEQFLIGYSGAVS